MRSLVALSVLLACGCAPFEAYVAAYGGGGIVVGETPIDENLSEGAGGGGGRIAGMIKVAEGKASVGASVDVSHTVFSQSQTTRITIPGGRFPRVEVVETGIDYSVTTVTPLFLIEINAAEGAVKPYLGVGPAFYFAETKIDSGPGTEVSTSEDSFGGEARVGARIRLAHPVSLIAEYRFALPDFDAFDATAHLFNVGLAIGTW